ncbi:MAG: NAD(P)-dependent oxidoreductase, partial [Candidatus Omnitrophota bacterium]
EGKVAASALDVFEAEPPKDLPFLKFDNVVLTPHLGASTEEAQVNVAVEIAEVVKNALLGRGICNAANYPCLDAEAFKVLEPYINLCEKLGLLVSQIGEGRIKKVNVIYSGQIIQHDTTPLTLALMKGLLFPVLQDSVNFINSLALAKERNVEIEEIKSTKEEEFANQVVVEVITDKEKRSITGTLSSNKQARIVKVDQFYVEATPLGVMILLYNLDKPGIIGNLGTLLGKYKINIAGMTFGREKQGGKAISLLNVDSPISSELLGEIKKLENILAVKVIKL